MPMNQQETQMTQEGQAIKLNYAAINSLSQIFESNIGPKGSLKMLITPSGLMKVTKDGSVLCREIQFTHPTAIVINRQVSSMAQEVGDGTSSFVVLLSKIFSYSVKYYLEGTSIHQIVTSIEDAKNELISYIKQAIKPLTGEILKRMVFVSLNTKVDSDSAEKLTKIILDSLENIQENKFFDFNMVEVIKLPGERELKLINGLILDHGNRHYAMPTYLENCAVLITNLSFEYEKPEVHTSFVYSSAEQREEIAMNERNFITERAKKITELAKELQSEGKSVVLITEKGIDPFCLEIFANANILGLRRAKRRNLERLVKMCGGNVISSIEEIKKENLGFCSKVWVEEIETEKFTFMEGVPFKNSCTILIKNSNQLESEQIHNAIKSTFKSLTHAFKEKVYIEGGPKIYYDLIQFMNTKLKERKNSIGYKILKESYEEMLKILIRNNQQNIEETLSAMEREVYIYEDVPENVAVVSSVLVNSCLMCINLMLIDEIIKAGRLMREEKKE